ncbi:MAG: hypothetical protein LKF48_09700 [Prevotella sp.]|nr:hypothetical protein [Prevotella sp.]MCH4183414.1 hypothetical protein [Prevotella sp.]
MLKIEDYIKQRKCEDGLNEFDMKERQSNNARIVEYCNDYFSNYLAQDDIQQKQKENEYKAEKYRVQLAEYSIDVQDWIVNIFRDHNIRMTTLAAQNLKDPLYLLFSSDNDYAKLNRKLFPILHKKYPWLHGSSQMLEKFTREYIHYLNTTDWRSSDCDRFQHYKDANSDKLTKWVEDTRVNYGIDLQAFATAYIDWYLETPSLWDRRIPWEGYADRYDYDIENSKDLLSISKLYVKINDKPYMQDRYNELLALLLVTYNKTACWLPIDILKGPLDGLGDADLTKIPRDPQDSKI